MLKKKNTHMGPYAKGYIKCIQVHIKSIYKPEVSNDNCILHCSKQTIYALKHEHMITMTQRTSNLK